MTDFNDSTLYISARSPFARRIRLAFLENGIRFDTKVFDVFKDNPELVKVNPLGRVPALELKSGQVLIDSNAILSALYAIHPSSYWPKGEAAALEAWRLSGLAAGLMEKTVEFFLETERPKEQQDPAWLDEVHRAVKNTLSYLESYLGDRASLLESGLTQPDLDMGAALAYLTLRYGSEWQKKFPKVAKYAEKLDQRESFRKTVPPPPAR